MAQNILIFILSFTLCLAFCFALIPLLKRMRAKQYILGYVTEHKSKSGTPTMGGISFVISSAIILAFFKVYSHRITLAIITIGIAYLCLGFLDDMLKIKRKDNQGLRAYQKLIFQLIIAIIASFFCYFNGITVANIPFTNEKLELGWFSIPLYLFIFLATTNCVNLTDGLDGLAGSSCLAYFLFIGLLIFIQSDSLVDYSIVKICFSLCGGLIAYLIFNTNKASVFMGDTGSMSLGAFVGSCSIFSGNMLYIPLIGVMFVLSGISVIIQVIYYKKTKKRVFLMAPLHHHFQMKGHSESKITFSYFAVTIMAGVLSILIYL